ncbi:hypothetical protein BDN72DRAFT_882391 [Pluteus cervinus]|uniref:Uncharacterized protein n=1 Tax=Pluteus cervinus TaxID=181527 RepID=A0ACD3AB31_9AGAR|nr:hypothetical protein BDN72DRAFT_882391 [Pluteus cervinus]
MSRTPPAKISRSPSSSTTTTTFKTLSIPFSGQPTSAAGIYLAYSAQPTSVLGMSKIGGSPASLVTTTSTRTTISPVSTILSSLTASTISGHHTGSAPMIVNVTNNRNVNSSKKSTTDLSKIRPQVQMTSKSRSTTISRHSVSAPSSRSHSRSNSPNSRSGSNTLAIHAHSPRSPRPNQTHSPTFSQSTTMTSSLFASASTSASSLPLLRRPSLRSGGATSTTSKSSKSTTSLSKMVGKIGSRLKVPFRGGSGLSRKGSVSPARNHVEGWKDETSKKDLGGENREEMKDSEMDVGPRSSVKQVEKRGDGIIGALGSANSIEKAKGGGDRGDKDEEVSEKNDVGANVVGMVNVGRETDQADAVKDNTNDILVDSPATFPPPSPHSHSRTPSVDGASLTMPRHVPPPLDLGSISRFNTVHVQPQQQQQSTSNAANAHLGLDAPQGVIVDRGRGVVSSSNSAPSTLRIIPIRPRTATTYDQPKSTTGLMGVYGLDARSASNPNLVLGAGLVPAPHLPRPLPPLPHGIAGGRNNPVHHSATHHQTHHQPRHHQTHSHSPIDSQRLHFPSSHFSNVQLPAGVRDNVGIQVHSGSLGPEIPPRKALQIVGSNGFHGEVPGAGEASDDTAISHKMEAETTTENSSRLIAVEMGETGYGSSSGGTTGMEPSRLRPINTSFSSNVSMCPASVTFTLSSTNLNPPSSVTTASSPLDSTYAATTMFSSPTGSPIHRPASKTAFSSPLATSPTATSPSTAVTYTSMTSTSTISDDDDDSELDSDKEARKQLEADRTRRRLEKLRRTLGDRVPAEVVLPKGTKAVLERKHTHSQSHPIPNGPELPPVIRPSKDRPGHLRPIRRASMTLSSFASSFKLRDDAKENKRSLDLQTTPPTSSVSSWLPMMMKLNSPSPMKRGTIREELDPASFLRASPRSPRAMSSYFPSSPTKDVQQRTSMFVDASGYVDPPLQPSRPVSQLMSPIVFSRPLSTKMESSRPTFYVPNEDGDHGEDDDEETKVAVVPNGLRDVTKRFRVGDEAYGGDDETDDEEELGTAHMHPQSWRGFNDALKGPQYKRTDCRSPLGAVDAHERSTSVSSEAQSMYSTPPLSVASVIISTVTTPTYQTGSALQSPLTALTSPPTTGTPTDPNEAPKTHRLPPQPKAASNPSLAVEQPIEQPLSHHTNQPIRQHTGAHPEATWLARSETPFSNIIAVTGSRRSSLEESDWETADQGGDDEQEGSPGARSRADSGKDGIIAGVRLFRARSTSRPQHPTTRSQSRLGDYLSEGESMKDGKAKRKSVRKEGSLVIRKERKQGWSGEWNCEDMQDVIQKLRALK